MHSRLTMAIAMAAATATSTLIGQKPVLGAYRVVLASQSPRRREIFDMMGLQPFEVIVSGFEEDLDKALYRGEGGPPRYAQDNAVIKARSVAERIVSEGGDQCAIVVGSDTIVDLDGEILEKPATPEEARAMLQRLSGRSHIVHSGVGIFLSSESSKEPAACFSESTRVTFGHLSAVDIDAYVASGEPMDKAGSYGIQGLGGQFVDGIDGCYFNVMGFPMRRFSVALSALLASRAN